MADFLQIKLFGPPAVFVGGEPIPRLKTRKGLWLLALLALRHGREVERSWLAGTLWPDSDESTALAYLRQSLTDLRKALGEAADRLVSTGSRSLRLDSEGVEVDVSRFDELIREGSTEALSSAVELSAGPLLEGCEEEWIPQERESRRLAWIGALERLAKAEAEQGDHASAVRRLRPVVAEEPLRESACREMMRSLAAQGETAAAMEAFRQLRLLLRSELNAEPDPETRQVYEELRQEARSRAAETAATKPATNVRASSESEERDPDEPSPHSRPRPRRLPRYVSEFVGREREASAIGRSLTASRLVTLTGLGGVGKTRLAVRVAEQAAGQFADGVAFVDFTPLTEPTLVPGAVGAALGIAEQRSRTPLESVAGFLEPRSFLLVMDNCEHVLAACVELASSLLTRCYDLKILATSRQRLRITGETEWRVPPLEVPPEPTTTRPTEEASLLRQNDAVSLFIRRAESARPDIEIGDSELLAAADVCRRLEGIPLALELAAARLHAMTVAQLVERLPKRLDLLVGGDAGAHGRQRTLRAMVDWSYNLLCEDERVLFRRLAVFVGGWSLEAAEATCDEGGLDVLNTLSSLVDKSLVVFSDDGARARYTMLETVRQYAREKLVRSGEEAKLRRIHRDYWIGFAERAALHLNGPEQGHWLDNLETEDDNLRAALDWCAEEPEGVSQGLRLAGALHRFWFQRAHFAEGRRRYAQLLRLDTQALPTPERALALQGSGNMSYRTGEYAAARELFEQALAIWEQRGDRAKEAELLTNIGNVAYLQGDYRRAKPLFQQALTLLDSAGIQAGRLLAIHGLGNLAFRSDDRATARRLFEQALDESRRCGSRAMEATVQVSLGLVQEAEREGDFGRAHFQQALALFREIGDVSQEMICLNNLGDAAVRDGDRHLATQYYREGLLLARESCGNRDERVVAYLLEGVATLAVTFDKQRLSAFLLAAGSALRRSIGVPRPPQDEVEFEQITACVRASLDASTFNEAWATGSAATVEQAIYAGMKMLDECVR